MAYQCKIVADSVSPAGKRLTTMVVTYPRFVHAELMTHRMFSRNSSSSRAIPIEKMIEQVLTDPVIPVKWGKNQKGMQAKEVLSAFDAGAAEHAWLLARDAAVQKAEMLNGLGVHKQLVNRLLEPWMWITVLLSSTEWANWFQLRCHPDAEDNLQKIAYMTLDAYKTSQPVERWVHLPFYNEEKDHDIQIGHLRNVCTARCARVSYLTHDGVRDPQRDIDLACQLMGGSGGIGHWSPFEHVADALPDPRVRSGNFIGWQQYRSVMDPKFIR